jgi:hypothetical protein
MIMFMREFKVIDSAESVEKLRMRLKDHELEQYGESFIPEHVYDAIKRSTRFSNMRVRHSLLVTVADLDSVDTNKMPRNFWAYCWRYFMKSATWF